MPSVSVVVCTYNRATSLRDTMNSIAKQLVPEGLTLDVLVIDNNSMDGTRAAIENFAGVCPWPVRYVLETRQGIGWARNRGLEQAQGDFVFFIDDDAMADENWIAKALECFEKTGADFIGGKIMPLWLTSRPSWLVDDLCGPIVRQDYGVERRRVKAEEGFLTANVGFRKTSVPKYGKFDPLLGRKGERWIGGEDFELFTRWFQLGASIFYEPTALVHHKVGPERLTPDFFRGWFVDIGYTQGHQLPWKPHYRFMVMPFWRWKLLIKAFFRYIAVKLTFAGNDVRLRAELWWRFQSSFLRERLGHWFAFWSRTARLNCPFSKI